MATSTSCQRHLVFLSGIRCTWSNRHMPGVLWVCFCCAFVVLPHKKQFARMRFDSSGVCVVHKRLSSPVAAALVAISWAAQQVTQMNPLHTSHARLPFRFVALTAVHTGCSICVAVNMPLMFHIGHTSRKICATNSSSPEFEASHGKEERCCGYRPSEHV